MLNSQSYVDAYNQYKTCNDKTVMINGNRYWKIIDKSKITEFEIIVLPKEVVGKTLEDELGNVFHVSTPMEYSFKGDVPEWYMETVSLMLMDIAIKKVGEYVRVVE